LNRRERPALLDSRSVLPLGERLAPLAEVRLYEAGRRTDAVRVNAQRSEAWFERRAGRGMKAATANVVVSTLIAFSCAVVFGYAPAMGEASHGDLESSVVMGIAVLVLLVLVSTVIAGVTAPKPASLGGWLAIPVGAAVACLGGVVTFTQGAGFARDVGLVMLLGAPAFAAALNRFGRGGSFAFIAVTPFAILIPAIEWMIAVIG
jgi:hypothetical protein